MQAKEKLERPLKWFVLPNESYKWDFILEKYFVESQQEAAAENVGIERLANDSFNKDYVIAKRRKTTRPLLLVSGSPILFLAQHVFNEEAAR